VKLDRIDVAALTRLMDEGRVSWADLAKTLRLSPAAAAQRVHRLEKAGVIRGYAALVDPEAAGRSLTAFVGIVLSSQAARARFLKRVAALDAAQECHHVTGEFDYLLKLRCSGTRDLERIISEDLKRGGGVSGTRTLIVLSTAKETPRLPFVSR
jgi:Lrp/AsnC family leucine-responsive transcriptional regulator